MKKIIVFLLFPASLLFTSVQAQDTTWLSLLFLGDIMQHDSQIADAYDVKTNGYDYRPCFQYIKPYIAAVDLAIGNLEVTLAGKPYKGYPQFSAPDELLAAVRDMGVDVLVTANNHSVDRGKAGVERTIDMLDSFDIQHTGTFKSKAEKADHYPLIVTRQGFKLAILNYTYGTNGLRVPAPNIVNMLDTAAIRADLLRAASLNPDVIVVFPHWGLEYQRLPSAQQKMIAALCFKYGAQLVIGSHPHVVQPMEWNKNENQLVAWSLGNFVSGQRKRYTDGGAMIRVELRKVSFEDGSSVTAIDTAGYILEWVYRTNDAERNYYVLPVSEVESDPAGHIADLASREAFHTFVSDSRSLFGKHNHHINELTSPARYSVRFNATDTVAVRRYLEESSGLHELIDDNYPMLEVGPMLLPDANHLYRRLDGEFPVEELKIIKD